MEKRIEKIARKIIAGGKYHYVKIQSVKDGEMMLYTEFKMVGNIPYNKVVYFIEQSAQLSGKIQNDLRSYGVDARGKQAQVKTKGNNLVVVLPYDGNFDEEQAREILKQIGIK